MAGDGSGSFKRVIRMAARDNPGVYQSCGLSSRCQVCGQFIAGTGGTGVTYSLSLGPATERR